MIFKPPIQPGLPGAVIPVPATPLPSQAEAPPNDATQVPPLAQAAETSGRDYDEFRARFGSSPGRAVGVGIIAGSMGTHDFNAILRKDGYDPETDSEMQLLLRQTLSFMDARDLALLIEKVKPFNRSINTIAETYPGEFLINMDGGRIVYWHDLRETLEQIPRYFDLTGRLGLSREGGVGLLFSLIDAMNTRYFFLHVGREVICPLIDIFEALLERGSGIRDDIPAFRNFLRVAKKGGELCRALNIVGVAVKAGISLARSLEFVSYIYKNATDAAYTFIALYDELYYLRTNDVDGETLFQALMNISGEDPLYSRGNYAAFTYLLHVASTHTPHSQQRILEKINEAAERQRLGAGGSALALRGRDDQKSDPISQASSEMLANIRDSAVVAAGKGVEEYFSRLAINRLVHGILPYRLQRGYVEGLADLKRLMEKESPEGAWVYDEGGQMWYSLGGRTNFSTGRVRHESFPYDVSKLSRRPLFIHIHPEPAETFVRPDRDSLAMPQFQKKLTKFLASMPSGADFERMASLLENLPNGDRLEAIIVTSLGITEIRFPNDAGRLREIAKIFRDLKDVTLLQFDAAAYYKKYGIGEKDITFVRKLVRHLNSQLPPGFEIIVHDFDEYVAGVEQ